MNKLKYCPFCGNKDVYMSGSDEIGEDNHSYWYVLCCKCGGSVFGDADKEKAAEAWNRRANDG